MKYLISGGGTGGHIYPALAIANEIKKRDKNAEIIYIGTKDGLEAELVPKAGFRFETVRVMGLPRKINKEFFKALKELVVGMNESRKIIKTFKPDIVIGTGGYVSGPIVLLGSLMGKKTLIHEQNAYPGITNKILGRFVDMIAVTFEEAIKYFKKKDKIIVTGNPIRSEIYNIDKTEAYKKLDLDPSKKVILSFGGSGGQLKLNDAILDLFVSENLDNIQWLHITGKRLYDDFNKKLERYENKISANIKILPYLYEMPEAMNIADIIIASSGAITLAEISAIGAASILVPKSYTAENHQEYNARAFEKAKASVVILEKELNKDNLKTNIDNILYNDKVLKEMKTNSKKMGNTKATSLIVDKVFDLIGK